MAQLTANAIKTFDFTERSNVPVKGSTEIFLGSAVGYVSGYGRQLVAGDVFAGFADQHVNNTSATDGAFTIPVVQWGRIQLSIASLAVTDIGKPVFASDGATFTLTATSNSRIGTVVRWVSTGIGIIEFYAANSKVVNSVITDSTGGTPSTTFAAIAAGASYAQADMVAVKNALSQIALNLNLITQAGQ